MNVQRLLKRVLMLSLCPSFLACQSETTGESHAMESQPAVSHETGHPGFSQSESGDHDPLEPDQPEREPSQERPSREFQVLSYNVLHLPEIAAIMHYKEDFRAKGQAEVLTAMAQQLDVIVFQEGFNKAAKRHLFDALSDDFPYSTELVGLYCEKRTFWDSVAGNCSNSIFVVNGGVKIVSKHPILAKHQYVFESSGKGTTDYNSNKGAVYTIVEVDGLKHHVVGAHLQADHGSFDGTDVRNAQLAELSQWIGTFSIPENEPLIFAGDMNVEYTKESAFDEMKFILDADTSYVFDPALATYSNVSNTIVKKRYPDYSDTLDYILISNNHRQSAGDAKIEVLRFQKENIDLSDHHAVLGQYTF